MTEGLHSLNMEAVVIISGGRSLRIKVYHSNQPNKGKVSLYSHYFHFNIPFKQLYTSYKMEWKCGCGTWAYAYHGIWKKTWLRLKMNGFCDTMVFKKQFAKELQGTKAILNLKCIAMWPLVIFQDSF